jgi:hypothetical protein
MLTIKGENKVEKEEEEGDYYYSERNYGHFRAYHRPAAGDRLRQRQGKVQERRSENDDSEEAGSTELAKKNRADRKLNLHPWRLAPTEWQPRRPGGSRPGPI